MSKYIIELNDKCARGIVVFGKTDEGVISTTQYVENLEVLNSDYINEHFGDLQDTAYQKGFEDGKAQAERGCDGCKYEHRSQGENPCYSCSKNYMNMWTAKETNYDIIRNGIQNWVTELNVKAEDIQKILEDMRHD